MSLEWADRTMCMPRWEGDGWISIPRCLAVASPPIAPCSCIIDSVVGLVKNVPGQLDVCALQCAALLACAYTVLSVWRTSLGCPCAMERQRQGKKQRPTGREPPAAPSHVPPTVSDNEPRVVRSKRPAWCWGGTVSFRPRRKCAQRRHDQSTQAPPECHVH